MIAAVVTAPSASADATDVLGAAVAAARGAPCGPLHADPVVGRAAEAINEATDRWVNNASRAVPQSDASSLLSDLGYRGSKSAILSGAAKNYADAVKAVLLQGYAAIPNCAYVDFGASALYNAKKDMTFVTVVLAG